MAGNNKVRLIILAIGMFLAGWFLHTVFSGGHSHPVSEMTEQSRTIWTCSMHPQIRQDHPGKCPICGMDLIPAGQTGGLSSNMIEFTPEAVKLMEIQTSPVERKFVTANISMAGKVNYDESRIKNIAAWVPGRIDRLYVDFTGTEVKKGDHLVYLYSPQLLSAQSELLEAMKSAQTVGRTSSDLVRQSVEGTLTASREKMRLLGLTAEQIESIEKTGQPTDHLTIYAPIGGVVIKKNAVEGAYVTTGQIIYTVADLSRVWIMLDAYESDLPWICYGQKVECTVEARPGDVFKGTINFIDPILDPQTRTVRLRVDVDNSQGKLKPEMFVRAQVSVTPTADGSVIRPQMAGKWICPMHPDIVKDGLGTCDICGMKLESAESLNLVQAGPSAPPLVIPATAPLITGTRAVVYVKLPDSDMPVFEGRQIVLGPRAGDYYIVKSGLKEGDVVVTKGNFKIDSELQIQAKPSMMMQSEELEKPAAKSEDERK